AQQPVSRRELGPRHKLVRAHVVAGAGRARVALCGSPSATTHGRLGHDDRDRKWTKTEVIFMTKRLFLGLCLAACVGIAGLWVALASEAKSAHGFSLASLKGEYIYALDGFTVQSDPTVHQPFAWAGKETY